MSMFQTAMTLAIANYFWCLLDNFFAWDATWRPLFFGWLTGLLLGDMHTGLIMGAKLEALYMGISSIGGVQASDACFGTVFPVTWVITQGANMDAALALAVPIGTLLDYVNRLTSPIGVALLGVYEKQAAENNQKKYTFIHWIYMLVVAPLPRTIVLFLVIYLGVGKLDVLTGSMPEWLLNGLGVSSGMLTAVGFGILTSMIWSPKLGVFFFVGFAMAEFMGLPTIAIAIFALAIAIFYFIMDHKIITSAGTKVEAKDEEDLF
ncbi:MAG: PTS sugar transporter subunit IIC [Erysipelotrichia bacterium]|nr:PTS sugar transporter subunit IIC [Erysipelotrichia bacterium]